MSSLNLCVIQFVGWPDFVLEFKKITKIFFSDPYNMSRRHTRACMGQNDTIRVFMLIKSVYLGYTYNIYLTRQSGSFKN